MNYDEKLLNEAAEIRNRNAQRIKKWIYEGEQRAPRTGEHYLYDSGSVGFVPPTIVITADFPILHPVPDDVVVVDGGKIDRLRDALSRIPPGADHRTVYDQINQALIAAHAVLACSTPPKPTDEILEALEGARQRSMGVDWLKLDAAIALREKELKERGE